MDLIIDAVLFEFTSLVKHGKLPDLDYIPPNTAITATTPFDIDGIRHPSREKGLLLSDKCITKLSIDPLAFLIEKSISNVFTTNTVFAEAVNTASRRKYDVETVLALYYMILYCRS
jgi:hypothetical protein